MSAASVAQGKPVTATASVSNAGTPLKVGVVDFYDGAKLAGSVQVVGIATPATTVGTAVLRRLFGPGNHSLKAVYRGTSVYPSGSSSVEPLTVTGGPVVDGGLQYAGTTDLSKGRGYDFLSNFTTADLDLDGVSDVLGLQFDEGQVALATGNPLAPGTFGTPAILGGGAGLTEGEQVLTADLNGDGLLDVLVTAVDAGEIRIFLATSPNTYATQTVLNSNAHGVQYPQFAVADFNHDGLPDIAAVGFASAGNTVVVWLNDPAHPGTFLPGQTDLLGNPTVVGLSVADMNGDGLPDLIVNDETGVLTVSLNDPAAPGLKWNTTVYHFASVIRYTTIADLNNDGVPDVIGGGLGGLVFVALGDPTHPGTLGSEQTYSSPSGMSGIPIAGIATGDIDGDGKLDVVAADISNHFTVFHGNGDGTLTPGPVQDTSPSPTVYPDPLTAWENTAVVVTDLDGDGLDDVVLSEERQDTVQEFRHLKLSGALIQTATDISLPSHVFTYGQPIIVTANETSTSGTMTGTVEFYDLASTATFNSIGTAPIVGGKAVVTVLNASIGFHDYAEIFHGDTTFAPSQSAIYGVVVIAGPSATTGLTSSPNPSSPGQTVVFIATVTASPNAPSTPTGTITLVEGQQPIGTATLVAGTATLNISTLALGSHPITAVYSGDTTFPSGASNLDIQVVQNATTTTLTATPIAATAFSPIQFTATVAAPGGPAAAGTVNFFAGAAFLGSGTLNSAGVATATISSLGVGVYQITAQYGGNSSFGASTSNSVTVTMTAAATSTTLAATPLSTTPFSPIQFTATVAAPGGLAVAGTVNFYAGATVIGSATLNSAGVATATISSLGAGVYQMTAQYGGNSSFTASTSNSVIVTLAAAATSTTLTVSPNPAVQGTTETMQAQVPGATSGTVQFLDGSTVVGSASVSTAGTASLQFAFAVGTHVLTAVYQGTAQFLGSTSPQVVLQVQAQDFTVTTSMPTLTIQEEHHAPMTVTVQSIGGFTDNITLSCSDLPAWATCAFTHPTLHLAAGGSVSTDIMVDTDFVLNYAQAHDRRVPLMCLLPLGLLVFRRMRRRPARLLAVMLMMSLGLVSGCTGRLPPHTEVGSYSVRILAHGSATAVDHNATWTLAVTP